MIIKAAYEVRTRKGERSVDLISDALPSGRLLYGGTNAVSNAIGYAQFYSRAESTVIRVYDEAGNVIETHEHAGEFKEFLICSSSISFPMFERTRFSYRGSNRKYNCKIRR